MIAMILQMIGMQRNKSNSSNAVRSETTDTKTKDGKSKKKTIIYVAGGICVVIVVGGVITYVAFKSGLFGKMGGMMSKITDPLGLFGQSGMLANGGGGLGGLGSLGLGGLGGLKMPKLSNLGGSKGLKLGGVWKGLPSKSVKTTFKQPNLFKKAPKLSIKKNPMKFKPSNPFSSGGKKKKKFKLF